MQAVADEARTVSLAEVDAVRSRKSALADGHVEVLLPRRARWPAVAIGRAISKRSEIGRLCDMRRPGARARRSPAVS